MEIILKGHDQFSLLPLWTFFAPNPGVNDYHLLFREDCLDGSTSSWEEIEINETRKVSTCFWNPNKRGKKILSDVIQTVIPLVRELKDTPKALMFTVPYLLILNSIMKEQNILKKADRKQFVLMASNGYEKTKEPGLILISEFHPIF